MTDEYDVGYCKPPGETQFKKGKSGNPSGRRKGSKGRVGIKKCIMNLLDKEMDFVENGKIKKITMMDAMFRRLITDAINGKPSAMKTMVGLIAQYKIGIDEIDPTLDNSFTIRFVD